MNANFKRLGIGIGIGVGILLSTQISPAAVVTLNPAEDTFINSLFPDNNAGSHPWLGVGRDGVSGVRRGLLRFDLASIPAGSTIDSAVLQLTVTRIPAISPVDSSFQIYRMATNWTEGDKSGNNGAAASPGEATWNTRATDAMWTEPGAASDAVETPSASAAVGATPGASYTWSGASVTSDIQFWLDNPASNFGWLLRSDAEDTSRSARGFGSSEDSANAGRLEITYTEPPGGTNLPPLSIERTDGNVRVFWPLPATGFVLDETTALVSPPAAIAWSEVGPPYETNAMHISITLPVAVGSKFYRLRRP